MARRGSKETWQGEVARTHGREGQQGDLARRGRKDTWHRGGNKETWQGQGARNDETNSKATKAHGKLRQQGNMPR